MGAGAFDNDDAHSGLRVLVEALDAGEPNESFEAAERRDRCDGGRRRGLDARRSLYAKVAVWRNCCNVGSSYRKFSPERRACGRRSCSPRTSSIGPVRARRTVGRERRRGVARLSGPARSSSPNLITAARAVVASSERSCNATGLAMHLSRDKFAYCISCRVHGCFGAWPVQRVFYSSSAA
jgi:hypothetical protein